MEILFQAALIIVDRKSRLQAAMGKPLDGTVMLDVITRQRRGGN